MKDVIWIGNSLERLSEFPEEVMDEIGYALYEAQLGKKSSKAKPLTNIDNCVMEIVSNFDKNTYRAVYTVKIGEIIYVLHCFQKKSKEGITTPKYEIDLIKQRLKQAKLLDQRGENKYEH